MIEPGDILGTWRLAAYVLHVADGTATHPLGPAPCGRLHYAPDGFVAAHLMAVGRVPLGADSTTAAPEAAARAMATHYSYCGRWRVEGDQVRHEIEICVVPERVRTVFMRRAAIEDGALVLTAEGVEHEGRRGTARLVWRRV